MLAKIVGLMIVRFASWVTGMRPYWKGCTPKLKQRIYYANHSSHGDFVLIWAALPEHLRYQTRPIAGLDYWGRGKIRHYLIQKVFNGVLVNRSAATPEIAALPIEQALVNGDSIIIFPEGTRNQNPDTLLPFKSGLYYLAKKFPQVEVVPVWIDNIHRVMPKGEVVPVPLFCNLLFGKPLDCVSDMNKSTYLELARNELIHLAGNIKNVH